MADKSELNTGIALGLALPFIIAVILIPTIMWNAFVLVKLWGWFVVPTFGLSGLGMAAAYGLALIVHMLKGQCGCKDDRETWIKIAMPFLGPALSLSMGWIVTWFL